MQKDLSYHQSAIAYNDALAVAAHEIAGKIPHPEVQKWCRSVQKQHEFHAKRHRSALKKIEREMAQEEETNGQEFVVEAQVAELVPTTVEVEVNLDGREN